MSNATMNKAEELLTRQMDKWAETATELIGSAAGTAVEPGKGLDKAKKTMMRPPIVVAALALVVAFVVLKLRRP